MIVLAIFRNRVTTYRTQYTKYQNIVSIFRKSIGMDSNPYRYKHHKN